MDTSLFVMPSFSSEREAPAPVVFDKLPPGNNQLQQPNPYGGIAALKPRASVFGATDIEQDEPEFMPGVTDSRDQKRRWFRHAIKYEKIKKRPNEIDIEESGNEQEPTKIAPAPKIQKEAAPSEQSAKKLMQKMRRMMACFPQH